MAGIKKRPVSPRQKMINLMYVVLMAMLALNVSTDVLEGFSKVEEGLNRTTKNATEENANIYNEFEQQMQQNPGKVKAWYDKAKIVKDMSDSLFQYADFLKEAIVKEADGMKGDVKNIRNKEDLEAATIKSNLSTDVPKKEALLGRNWQQAMFESMPVAAATTLLTKLQSDVRHAEGEVLHSLIKGIDVKDVRVNALNAYVIPNSQTIVQGSRFEARIIMAAVDTTQQPRIYIGGREVHLNNGLYGFNCGSTGDFTFNGYIEVPDRSGETLRRDFSQKYTVVAPSATVSADLMNVLYAGYNNPMSVSVPGVPLNQIVASMTGGTLTPTGPGKYIAKPEKPGTEATITVSSKANGGMQKMGEFKFRVRRLPDPTAYIAYKDAEGNNARYQGGRGFARSTLLSVGGIGAAIDDGLLNIEFKVVGFETTFFDDMGNAMPEISNSDRLTDQQKSMFQQMRRGRRFYISRVKAVGPDGSTRTLPQSLEVIVN